ncbi:MAG: hypothetical protein LC772_04365 [Chloroflexi bacterium]|nr:hypothetical protein [Chloroflexota bacterium]
MQCSVYSFVPTVGATFCKMGPAQAAPPAPSAAMPYPPQWNPQPVQACDPDTGPDFTGRSFHGLMVGLQKGRAILILWTVTGILIGGGLAFAAGALGFPLWPAAAAFWIC